MEKVIVLLSENYDKLETRLKKEEKQFKEFSIRLEQENQTLQILQPTTLPFDPNK
jgi:hypothetical protein